MRRVLILILGILMSVAMVGTATAEPLPENCERVRGTVTCTTFEGPGNNQAGVGNEQTVETKGNTKNKNPEPQDLQDECEQNPESSRGRPIACP